MAGGSDASITSPPGSGVDRRDQGRHCFPDTVVTEEAASAFSLPDRRWHTRSWPPGRVLQGTLGDFAGLASWRGCDICKEPPHLSSAFFSCPSKKSCFLYLFLVRLVDCPPSFTPWIVPLLTFGGKVT